MNTAIIVFVAIGHLAFVSGVCDWYGCFSDNLKVYEMFGSNYTCDDGKFCNIGRLDSDKECKPCMDIKDVCGATFECDENDKKRVHLKIKDRPDVICQGNTECNTNPEINCKMCITSTCPKDVFKCLDQKHVIMKNVENPIECQGDTVCNEANVYPCIACIPPEEEPTPTATTTKKVPTTPKTTTKGKTTISTTTTKGPTTPVPKPDCNDGLGFKKPCRRGPEGIYFRCIFKMFWWGYEEVRCAYQKTDNMCKDDKTIC